MNDRHSMNDMNDRHSVDGSLAGRGGVPGAPRMARAAAWPRMARAALLSCAAALAACGGGGSSDTPPGPDPEPVVLPPAAIEVTLTFAGAGGAGAGGSVEVTVGSESSTYSASVDFSFASGADVSLLAVPDDGYEFAGWTLAGGLSCTGGPEALACVLEADLAAAAGSPSAGAAFAAIATTLTVSAVGDGGRVTAAVRGAAADPVGAGASEEYAFDVESSATLTAEPDPGYRFAGWTGACVGAGMEVTCVLDAGRVGDAEVGATFAAAETQLTLSVAGPGAAGGEASATTTAGDPLGAAAVQDQPLMENVDAPALPGVTLAAAALPGYAFSSWTLSAGLSCAGGTEASSPACWEPTWTPSAPPPRPSPASSSWPPR